MVTYYEVRDVLECGLHQRGPDARALAGAVAELVPLRHRSVAYEGLYDKLRTAMWPSPRCACDLARLALGALPLIVR